MNRTIATTQRKNDEKNNLCNKEFENWIEIDLVVSIARMH
jgi:hypothetical protein